MYIFKNMFEIIFAIRQGIGVFFPGKYYFYLCQHMLLGRNLEHNPCSVMIVNLKNNVSNNCLMSG